MPSRLRPIFENYYCHRSARCEIFANRFHSWKIQRARYLSIFREREHRGRGEGERETSIFLLCSVDRFRQGNSRARWSVIKLMERGKRRGDASFVSLGDLCLSNSMFQFPRVHWTAYARECSRNDYAVTKHARAYAHSFLNYFFFLLLYSCYYVVIYGLLMMDNTIFIYRKMINAYSFTYDRFKF